jgi:hypothetical protein
MMLMDFIEYRSSTRCIVDVELGLIRENSWARSKEGAGLGGSFHRKVPGICTSSLGKNKYRYSRGNYAELWSSAHRRF